MSGLAVGWHAGGFMYLFCAHCQRTLRIWGPEVVISVAELVTAELEHAEVHDRPINYGAMYDGFYEDGLG